ncbi:MAG: protein kinase, partial [Pirellulaceae bacterium]
MKVQEAAGGPPHRERELIEFARQRALGFALLTKSQTEQFLSGTGRRLRLGKFVILNRLGTGAMGTVYRARDEQSNQNVALRILPTALANDCEYLSRLRDEVRVAANLDHANIGRVFEAGHHEDQQFVASELYDGATLAERLDRLGPLSLSDSIDAIGQLASALQYASERSLTHRDVKPANVMIVGKSLKLLDFGLARPAALGVSATGSVSILGDPDYLSPEALDQASQVDTRSDLYSLGCVWFAMLSGAPPLADRSFADKLQADRGDIASLLRESLPQCDPSVVHLIERLLAKSPEDRWPSAVAFLESLQALPIFETGDSVHPSLFSAAVHCPSVEVLEEFGSGRLSESDTTNVQAHLDFCEACQTFVDDASGRDGLEETIACSDGSTSHAPVAPATQMTRRVKPKHLGQYEILEVLGRGGMGAVYRARHIKLDKVVALKVLSSERWQDSGAIERFQREMRAVGKLHHPNIVAAHDAGEADGQHYLVMEYVDGVDLATLVGRLGPLPVAEACELIRQAAIGLQHASTRGLVHRDVKPSNLIVGRDSDEAPQVKVLDLGLALLDEPTSNRELTGADQFMGTIDYMAPEQGLDTHGVDVRADVYSLGATLHKLLTGQVPFPPEQHASALQMMVSKTQVNPSSIRLTRPNLPDELVLLVDRTLSRSPNERPSTPAELAAALATWAEGAQLTQLLKRFDESEVQSDRLPSPESLGSWFATGAHDVAATQSFAARSKKPAESRRRLIPRSLAIAAGFAAAIAAAIVFYVKTDTGSLEIVTDDPNVKVIVEQAGKKVTIDPGDGQTLKILDTGTWQVHLAEGAGDFQLEPNRFTLTRNEKEVVRVRRIAMDDRVATSDRQDRSAAEWIINRGGVVGVNGLDELITNVTQLPDDSFRLTTAFFPYLRVGAAITDQELSILRGCPDLQRLALRRSEISDSGLANFATFHDLRSVILDDSNVTDVGLTNLANSKELSVLKLSGTQVTDEGLRLVRHWPSLSELCLANTKISDAGLAHLKDSSLAILDLRGTAVSPKSLDVLRGLPKLQILYLQSTQFGSDHVDTLAASQPRCRIEWDGGVIEPTVSGSPLVKAFDLQFDRVREFIADADKHDHKGADYALKFDGKNSYVEIPEIPLNAFGPLTIECLAKCADVNQIAALIRLYGHPGCSLYQGRNGWGCSRFDEQG